MATNRQSIIEIINQALQEDLGHEGDITSNSIISPKQDMSFAISNRQELVLCGIEIIEIAINSLDPNLKLKQNFKDGDFIKPYSIIAEGTAKARAVLATERTALNLLQHLCGVASLTREYVNIVKHTKAIIRDTRKTIPSLRHLQKYAVKIGGGENHRFTLDEMILIKDNHIAIAGSIVDAFTKAKATYPNKIIEIECDTLEQVEQALQTSCESILLDNMSVSDLKEAVKLATKSSIKLEASGGVNLNNVKEIAETGVDYIAIGNLTHSVQAKDIGLDVINL